MHKRWKSGVLLAFVLMNICISYSFLFSEKTTLSKSRLSSLFEASFASGASLRQKGNFQKAVEEYAKALGIAEQMEKDEAKVECLMSLGLLYWNLGQLKESTEKYEEALRLAQKIGLAGKENECLAALEIYRFYNEGKKCRTEGDNQGSIKNFQEAIELSRKIKSREHELKCLRQLSLTYWEMNDMDMFFKLNEEGLKLANALNHKREKGKCLNNIGIYYSHLSKYFLSLKYLDEAYLIAKQENSITDLAYIFTNLGFVYKELGELEKALDLLKKTLEIDYKEGNEFEICLDLNNIGNIYLNKGLFSNRDDNFMKALSFYNESLKIARKYKTSDIETKVLSNLGFINFNLNKYSESLHHLNLAYNLAKKMKDLEMIATILNNMAHVYSKMGKYDKADELYQKSIEAALKMNNNRVLWEAYFGLGQCLESQQKFNLAIESYKNSIKIIENIRSQISFDAYKSGFVRNKFQVYECLINLLYALHLKNPNSGYDQEIFYTVERAKARAFLDIVSEARAEIHENLDPSLRNREREISNFISSIILELSRQDLPEERRKDLLNKLEQAEDEHLRIISIMKNESSKIVPFGLPDPYPLETIQDNLLDEKTALVEYFLGEKNSYLFLIKKRDSKLFSLPSRQDIENSIKTYLKMLSSPPKAEFRGEKASKRIFQELLFPLGGGLAESIQELIIIPDGPLFYLPFETLIISSSEREYEDEYLIYRYKISYAPSSSSLLFLKEKRLHKETSKGLLAFGDPVYEIKKTGKKKTFKTHSEIMREIYLNEGFDFSPLPFSRKEVLSIAKYFEKNRIDLYLGKKASEETIKKIPLQEYQIIHFACHGFLDEKFPFRSALVLSLGRSLEEDGFLQVREMHNIKMNADLVVLSACQTGRGTLEKGEGILGLPRIFFYAGARSVLTTLWKISDKATSEFMNVFYYYLALGNDIGESLRLTKLKMMQNGHSHPFYWAAFVLNGDSFSKIDIMKEALNKSRN